MRPLYSTPGVIGGIAVTFLVLTSAPVRAGGQVVPIKKEVDVQKEPKLKDVVPTSTTTKVGSSRAVTAVEVKGRLGRR